MAPNTIHALSPPQGGPAAPPPPEVRPPFQTAAGTAVGVWDTSGAESSCERYQHETAKGPATRIYFPVRKPAR